MNGPCSALPRISAATTSDVAATGAVNRTSMGHAFHSVGAGNGKFEDDMTKQRGLPSLVAFDFGKHLIFVLRKIPSAKRSKMIGILNMIPGPTSCLCSFWAGI